MGYYSLLFLQLASAFERRALVELLHDSVEFDHIRMSAQLSMSSGECPAGNSSFMAVPKAAEPEQHQDAKESI
jgi:hypothetical protein